MKWIKAIKYLLWRFDLWGDECPYCKKELHDPLAEFAVDFKAGKCEARR